ncbi:ABC-type antimicrobial peptide transport system, ATPase component [Hahella chejuensis KCTC 2396]|uniref:Lipoprotein-releasing system ATP-binding protein LolD n=1 Tax=Hahella chejuensis (strain KCTC 2396) TaxID=349521 RepID=LOLD_HAHCH|nr:lipoprotein ABC transporter ATP-binding protein LolD [Hahella chejuensis]Q2SJK0.1 RecName: Full=Lipoprotein-releasing system ATP-binding protein LolD [Hahella chejuensis KCTC 2396]ABC29174.1 ABC-type antimicrobial peptide transport system, ATPase component [Hahella chejuensis KCTC 2396]
MSSPVLKCQSVHKVYVQGKESIEVLRGVNIALYPEQTVAIVGASGSGKSTLLNIMGALDHPSSGSISISGQDVSDMDEKAKARLRNAHVGFVYQFHHLLPEFSALENVCMPLLLRGVAVKEAKKEAEYWLGRVGLSHRLKHRPGQLSGGERQRVAIARALSPRPSCVLMDEPTGNLDPETAESVQALLWDLVRQNQTSFVLVTHDYRLAARMDEQYSLEEGVLAKVAPNSL